MTIFVSHGLYEYENWSTFNNFQLCLTCFYTVTLIIALFLVPKVWNYYFIILHLPMAQSGISEYECNIIAMKNIYGLLYQRSYVRMLLYKLIGGNIIYEDILEFLEPDDYLIGLLNNLSNNENGSGEELYVNDEYMEEISEAVTVHHCLTDDDSEFIQQLRDRYELYYIYKYSNYNI